MFLTDKQFFNPFTFRMYDDRNRSTQKMQILEHLQFHFLVFYRFIVVNKCNKSWKFE